MGLLSNTQIARLAYGHRWSPPAVTTSPWGRPCSICTRNQQTGENHRRSSIQAGTESTPGSLHRRYSRTCSLENRYMQDGLYMCAVPVILLGNGALSVGSALHAYTMHALPAWSSAVCMLMVEIEQYSADGRATEYKTYATLSQIFPQLAASSVPACAHACRDLALAEPAIKHIQHTDPHACTGRWR